jgi:Tsi6
MNIKRLNLLETGLYECLKLAVEYPNLLVLVSIKNQIEYLLKLEKNEISDRSRLKDIIIGTQTIREIMALDESIADLFLDIADEADKMER